MRRRIRHHFREVYCWIWRNNAIAGEMIHKPRLASVEEHSQIFAKNSKLYDTLKFSTKYSIRWNFIFPDTSLRIQTICLRCWSRSKKLLYWHCLIHSRGKWLLQTYHRVQSFQFICQIMKKKMLLDQRPTRYDKFKILVMVIIGHTHYIYVSKIVKHITLSIANPFIIIWTASRTG